MIGSFRLLLALMVALNHLWNPLANLIGSHALVTFYMISGYLITLIVNKTYNGRHGFLYFIANRALRIYPCYLLILLLTIIGLLTFPTAFNGAYTTIYLPEGAVEWSKNISLFLLHTADAIPVPPAWTLGIELTFYILIALIGRYRSVVLLWFILSLSWHILLVSYNAPFSDRYTPPTAASLFFSIGAMIYWFRDRMPLSLSASPLIVLVLTFIFFPILVQAAGMDRTLYGYYVSGFLGAIILVILLNPQQKPIWGTFQKDKLCGDLAYPVYLFHYFSGAIVNIATLFLFGKTAVGTTPYCLTSLAITFSLSWAYVHFIDRRLEYIRDKIRYRAQI